MPKTLLLADDSVTIQKVVGITFANEDVELVTVDNGDEALARARELRPDAVLADVSMPGLDGYALCAELKRDPALAHIPVLLLTGTFEPYDAARASEVHPDGHIAKPFEAQVLIDQVFGLLNGGAAAAPAPEPRPDASLPKSEPQPEAVVAEPWDEGRRTPAIEPEGMGSAPDDPAPEQAPHSSEASEASDDAAQAWAPPAEADLLEALPLEESEENAPDITRIFDPLGSEALAESDLLSPIEEDREFDLEDPPDLMHDFEPLPEAAIELDSGEANPPRDRSELEIGSSFPQSAGEITSGADSAATPLLGVDGPEPEGASLALSREVELESPPTAYVDPAEEFDETPITPFLNLERERAELDALPEDDLPWLEPEPEPEPEAASSVRPRTWTAEVAEASEPRGEDRAASHAAALAPPAPDAAALRQVLEKMAWEAFGPLTERLVTDVVRKVEEVAWEVIPDLAERLIRSEIERLKSED